MLVTIQFRSSIDNVAEWGPLKPSPPAAAYTSSLTTPLKKMLHALT